MLGGNVMRPARLSELIGAGHPPSYMGEGYFQGISGPRFTLILAPILSSAPPNAVQPMSNRN